MVGDDRDADGARESQLYWLQRVG